MKLSTRKQQERAHTVVRNSAVAHTRELLQSHYIQRLLFYILSAAAAVVSTCTVRARTPNGKTKVLPSAFLPPVSDALDLSCVHVSLSFVYSCRQNRSVAAGYPSSTAAANIRRLASSRTCTSLERKRWKWERERREWDVYISLRSSRWIIAVCIKLLRLIIMQRRLSHECRYFFFFLKMRRLKVRFDRDICGCGFVSFECTLFYTYYVYGILVFLAVTVLVLYKSFWILIHILRNYVVCQKWMYEKEIEKLT